MCSSHEVEDGVVGEVARRVVNVVGDVVTSGMDWAGLLAANNRDIVGIPCCSTTDNVEEHHQSSFSTQHHINNMTELF